MGRGKHSESFIILSKKIVGGVLILTFLAFLGPQPKGGPNPKIFPNIFWVLGRVLIPEEMKILTQKLWE